MCESDFMKEKASFGKRAMAQLIDMFIVGIIIGIISMGFSTSRIEKLNDEASNLMNDYVSGDISSKEYLSSYIDITYDMNKASLDSNLVYLAICIGYFLIFQYLNRGATIGKRLMKIRAVSDDGSDIGFIQMFIRTSIINEILPMIMLIILVFVSRGVSFFIFYSLISFIENIFILVCVFMILYRKDRLAIHDIMSRSMVIEDK